MSIKDQLQEQYHKIRSNIFNSTVYQQLEDRWRQTESRDQKKIINNCFIAFVIVTLLVLLFIFFRLHKFSYEVRQKNASIIAMRELAETSNASQSLSVNVVQKKISNAALYSNIPLDKVLVKPSDNNEADSGNNMVTLSVRVSEINAKQLIYFASKVDDELKKTWIKKISIEAKKDFSGYLSLDLILILPLEKT